MTNIEMESKLKYYITENKFLRGRIRSLREELNQKNREIEKLKEKINNDKD